MSKKVMWIVVEVSVSILVAIMLIYPPTTWDDAGTGTIDGVFSHNFVSGQFNNIHFDGWEDDGHDKILCVIPGEPCWWPEKTLSQLQPGVWYRVYYRWDTWYPSNWPESGCLPTQWEYFVKAVDSNGNEYLPLYE